MEIVIDTREHQTRQASRRYKSFGLPYFRSTLDYGDYTYQATMPDGSKLFPTNNRIKPLCCIERKQNLDELAMCFGSQRKRFEREFQRASDNNARMHLLVENASWEKLLAGDYRSKMNPKSLLASLTAWQERYGFGIIFCDEATSGILIKEILYRDLKGRLERGELDK